MAKKFFLILVFCTLLFLSTVYSQELTSNTEDLTEFYKDITNKKTFLSKEVDRLPDNVESETQKIIAVLDSLFKNEIPQIIAAHHKQVEEEIEKVTLSESESLVHIIFSQAKAAVGYEEELKKICNEFVNRAQEVTEPLIEQLKKDIEREFKPVLEKEIEEAQENIRKPFQEAIAAHFPVFTAINLPPAPLSPELIPSGLQSSKKAVGVLSVVGIAMLFSSLIIKKILNRLAIKITGKAFSKIIPVIGILLLAKDVYDATQAKKSLESDLREQYIETYREEVKAETLWTSPINEDEKSFKDDMTSSIRELLNKWSNECRNEVDKVLEVATIISISAPYPILRPRTAKFKVESVSPVCVT